jgi:hypothetical protein
LRAARPTKGSVKRSPSDVARNQNCNTVAKRPRPLALEPDYRNS